VLAAAAAFAASAGGPQPALCAQPHQASTPTITAPTDDDRPALHLHQPSNDLLNRIPAGRVGALGRQRVVGGQDPALDAAGGKLLEPLVVCGDLWLVGRLVVWLAAGVRGFGGVR